MDQRCFTVKFGDKEYPALYVTDKTSALQCLEKLMQKDVLFSLDTETEPLPEYKLIKTAGLSPLMARIRLIQIYDGKTSIVFDLKHIADDRIFIEFLESKRFIAHNALFDLQFFKRMGVKNMSIGCTMLIAKLIYHAIYPTDAGISVSLKNLTEQILKIKIQKELQISDWSNPELTYEQIEYASTDAISVLLLAKRLAPGLTKLGMERVYQLYKAAQHPIADMQMNGFLLDVEAHKASIQVWKEELYQSRKRVLQMTGLSELTPHKLATYLERTLTPEMLAYWPRTEGGEDGKNKKLSTSADTFADFSFLDIVKPLSEHGKLAKLCSTYGATMLGHVSPVTGRVHAQYQLCGARTGRLSSSKPNLQNAPRDKEIRQHFIAPEGKVLIVADYSQIEVRVGAELSQDSEMLAVYRNGLDLHTMTAMRIANVSVDKVTKEMRQAAKAIMFGNMFGIGSITMVHYAKKPPYNVEMSEYQARELINNFREIYSRYYDWQMNQAEIGKNTEISKTPCGKVRKLERGKTYGPAMNTPIQGGASECTLAALNDLQPRLQDVTYRRLVNCVHDELVLEVEEHPSIIEESICVLKDSMVKGFQEIFPNGITKNLVEVGVGKDWASAKES